MFGRPFGPPYRTSWEDLMRNYLIGWNQVGSDTIDMAEHFREQFEEMGAGAQFDEVLEQAQRQARSPLGFFDAIFCLNLDSDTGRWAAATRRHEQLDIGWQVERFPGVETPENPHQGHAIAFRRMVAEASRRGYDHVLILEDDAVFLDTALTVMGAAGLELTELEWDLCFLGACVWSSTFPFVTGSDVLQQCGPVTCTHAVAIHRRAYDRILADIPSDPTAVEEWLREWLASDQYLCRRIADGTFTALITSPRIASQPSLLPYEDGDRALAARYVI
jgi:hypothetical protein